jgi:hypothetical protein
MSFSCLFLCLLNKPGGQPVFPYMIAEFKHPKITKKAQGQYLGVLSSSEGSSFGDYKQLS